MDGAGVDIMNKPNIYHDWKDPLLASPQAKGWHSHSKSRGALSPRPNTPVSKAQVTPDIVRTEAIRRGSKVASKCAGKPMKPKAVPSTLPSQSASSQSSRDAKAADTPRAPMQAEDATSLTKPLAPTMSDRCKKPRRKAHNAIERRYRTKLNARIAELRNSVPSLRFCSASEIHANSLEDPDDQGGDAASGLRTNKALILEKATEYIKELESRNQELQAELHAKDQALAAAREQTCSPGRIHPPPPLMANQVNQINTTNNQTWTPAPAQEYAPWENEPTPWLGQWTLPLSGLFV
ncbi:MAG: hypothetical protein LQ351_000057 [Letrouitia transgressa]|nr:MAG: hypothetical protein LQ351_000057 [Letrouitia transgressa]